MRVLRIFLVSSSLVWLAACASLGGSAQEPRRLTWVKIVQVTNDDSTYCRERGVTTFDDLDTGERFKLCGRWGNAGDKFTIDRGRYERDRR
jgi:putative hemolysin